MRVQALRSFLVGSLIAACGAEPASTVSQTSNPSDHPGGGIGSPGHSSFPLPSYWGAASQYAAPATITVTGGRSVTLHGGAFAVTATTPGQPWAMLAPAVWVGYGDPIFGIVDGVFEYDAYAVFRPKDGLLESRTLTVGDVDPSSYAEFEDIGAGWGANPEAMNDVQVTLSSVSLAGTSAPDARRAGTYYVVHGTMDFTIPPRRGEVAQAAAVHVEF